MPLIPARSAAAACLPLLLALTRALPAAAAAPLCPGCNVVLVSLDALRADALGVYGYNRDTSPNLDRLAARGAVFLNAYAQAPNTFPSHMSIFTGQYPWTHGVRHIERDVLPWDALTLPEMLKLAGYSTYWGARHDSPHLDLSAGFGRGFDNFIPPGPRPDGPLTFSWEREGLAWMEKNRSGRFFAFLHTENIHSPYIPERSSVLRFSGEVPEFYASAEELRRKALAGPQPGWRFPAGPAAAWRVRRDMGLVFKNSYDQKDPADLRLSRLLYDACVYDADRQVGSLYAGLERLGLAGRTILVLTSDHGEEFMEHGAIWHNNIYTEHLRVPLIVVIPGAAPGVRTAALVQAVDLVPTLLEAVGAPAWPGLDGRSLLPLLGGGGSLPPARFAYAQWQFSFSVRDPRYTYIGRNKCSGTPSAWSPACVEGELYDRQADPGEKKNIQPANKEQAEALARQLLRALRTAGKGDVPWPAMRGEDGKSVLDTGYW